MVPKETKKLNKELVDFQKGFNKNWKDGPLTFVIWFLVFIGMVILLIMLLSGNL